MQKYTDVVTSARSGAAVPDALVTVKTSPAGATATIYSDDGVTTQSNPLTTDSNGEFTFYAADGEYTLTVSGTGITSRTIGPVILHDPADSDDYMPSTDVSFTPSGTGAVANTAQAKMREQFSVLDFIPVALHSSIVDGTNTTDLTTYVQAALDAMSTAGGGAVLVPRGSYKCSSSINIPTLVDLVGESRLRSRLMFALTSAGTCVTMAGSGVGRRSSIRRIRIDGTNCTNNSVVGLSLNLNNTQLPILDEVTIYGGYEAGGADTGLKNGIVTTVDGEITTASFQELNVEGCHGDAVSMDTIDGGAHNILNWFGGGIQNNGERNLYIAGPNDDTATFQLNFYGVTIQGASYANTGIASSVHVQGAKVHFSECWLEALATPNWATHEVRLENGRVEFHNCHIAWAQRALLVQNGTAVFSGYNTVRTNTAGIAIGGNGFLVRRGVVDFLGAGTPIQITDATSVIDWGDNIKVDKTDDYTVVTSDVGRTFSNFGAKKNITLTMALMPTGATLKIINAMTDVRNATYRWTASGSGTNEYYLELAAGGNPGFAEPTKFYQGATARTAGTAGALANLEWDYADNDTLGYSTIYYRLDSGDPDSTGAGNIYCTYTITLAPVSNQKFVPLGTTTTDSIVSDGTPGTCMEMTLHGATSSSGFWIETNRNGTWT
jgi:hypothetical protein